MFRRASWLPEYKTRLVTIIRQRLIIIIGTRGTSSDTEYVDKSETVSNGRNSGVRSTPYKINAEIKRIDFRTAAYDPFSEFNVSARVYAFENWIQLGAVSDLVRYG